MESATTQTQTQPESTREQRLACLLQIREKTVQLYHEMANVIREMDEAGDDMEAASRMLGEAMVSSLRLLASGQLVAEALFRFSLDPRLLRDVKGLPLSEQRRLAEAGKIELVVIENNKRDVRMVDPLAMLPAHRARVFATNHIRSVAEQHAFLDRELERTPSVWFDVGPFSINNDTGEVRLGQKRICPIQMEAAWRAVEGILKKQRGKRAS